MKKSSIRVFLLCIIFSFNAKADIAVPDFGLHTLEGKPYALDKVIGDGQWTVVMFWATDCTICKQQVPLISAFHDKRKTDNAKVIGIAIDGMEKQELVKSHLDTNPTSYPNYIGSLAMIGFNFQAITEQSFRGTPTYLVFSPEGKLMGQNAGPMRLEALENFIDKRS